jgi:hypothetical protein
VQSAGLSPYGQRHNAPGDPTTPCFYGSQVLLSSIFNSEFNFLNFHVAGFSYGPTTCDALGRVSHSRTASNVAAATSKWILATTAFKWILAATASSRSFRPEFQHSSPTFRPRILVAAAVGTSSWRASPAVGNASVDDTDAQPQRPSSSPATVSHSCLLSIAPFII